MNHVRQSTFDRIYLDLPQFLDYEQKRYPQAVRERMVPSLLDSPLYIGQQPRRWWHGPWVHLAYFGVLIVVLVIGVLLAGGSFEMRLVR